MRYVVVILAAMVLMSCSRSPETNHALPTEGSAPDPQMAEIEDFAGELPVEFLLASAVADFETHGPTASDVRNIRLGHATTADGEKQYVLCGEFLPAEEGGNAEWWSFATIKTSGYEQWIGAQAVGICQRSSIIWDEMGDLTLELRHRLDNTK